MLHRAFSELMTVFPPATLEAAMRLVLAEGLLSVRLSDGLLHARVKSEGRLLDVYIDLKRWPQQPSRCSCEMKQQCIHAAASLLHLRHQAREKEGSRLGKIALDDWMDAQKNQQVALEQKTPTYRIFYALNFQSQHYLIEPWLVKLLKHNKLGKRTQLERLEFAPSVRLGAEDQALLNQLKINLALHRSQVRATSLMPLNDASWLHAAVGAQCVWHEGDNMPWAWGDELVPDLQWQVLGDGQQQCVWMSHGEAVQLCWLDKRVIYVDSFSLELGWVHFPCHAEVLEFLQSHACVHVNEVSRVAAYLSQHAPQLPQPFDLTQAAQVHQPPKPVIALSIVQSLTEETEDLPIPQAHIDLKFEYAGETFSAETLEHATNSGFYQSTGSQVVRIVRDETFERNFCASMQQALVYPRDALWLNQPKILEHIQTHFIPWVKQQGAHLETQDELFATVLDEQEVEWYDHVAQDQDFLAYELGVMVEGKKINLVPILLDFIAQYSSSEWSTWPEDHPIRIAIGPSTWLMLPFERIRPLMEFVFYEHYHYRSTDRVLQLKQHQWLMIQISLQALKSTLKRQWTHERWIEPLYQLIDKQRLAQVKIPDNFQATLRDYQHEGLNWLQALREQGFSGILADDMGLGKTVQAIAHILIEKEEGRLVEPVLIIAPLSLIENWHVEFERFAPSLKVCVHHGTRRENLVFQDYDVIISTYGLIQRDQTLFLKQHFYYLILDEAQWIKNARAQTTLVIQQLQASYRLCLSGTPFENHLGELWSLFNFIMPGLLLDKARFRTYFQLPIEKENHLERQHSLMMRIQPFLLRRSKKDVAAALPEKTLMTHAVSLEGRQRDLYEWIRLSMEKRVRESIAQHGLAKSQMVFLDALLKLRQVCCDPRLVSLTMAQKAHGESAKLQALMELVDVLLQEGRRILIFSQFTSMLALIEKEIQTRGYRYLKMTGQSKHRQQLVDEFQLGETPLFLISLKTGGVGLNLTQADTVIHYDPWWNPAVEDQATDRTHRLGQKNAVFVYRLVAAGTVEEMVMRMQEKKRALFDAMLARSHHRGLTLTEEDIDQFFRPLTD